LVKGLTNAFFKYEDGKTYEQYVQPWICGRLGKKSNVVEVMIKTGGAAGEKGDVTLDMMVRFQGFVPDTPERVDKVAGKKMRARVSISGMTYKVVEFTASASAEWQGRVTFKDVELNRRHRIYVWGQKHPQRRICDKTPKENRVGVYRCEDGLITLAKGVNKLDFTGILLLVGDLNIGSGQDNVVDAFDTTFVRQNFNSRNQVVLEKADFDLNGVINARDWALIQASLEVKPGDSLR
ncbi:hypothetical protein HYT33_03820, partial [Candidatus Roizmanbacteria bacterium]|nr:hypothetical protein [Candidatus Roizmanbacteria bacterium]